MKNKYSFLLLAIIAVLLVSVPVLGQSLDLKSELDLVSVITPGEYSTDQTSEAIDGGNYRVHMFGIYVSPGSYSTVLGMNFNLKHCATSVGSFTAVDQYDMVGVTPNASGTIYTVDEDIVTASYQELLYVGRMPYLKLIVDMIGDHSSASPTVSVIDVKGGKIISR